MRQTEKLILVRELPSCRSESDSRTQTPPLLSNLHSRGVRRRAKSVEVSNNDCNRPLIAKLQRRESICTTFAKAVQCADLARNGRTTKPLLESGGGRGIRTPERLPTLTVFKPVSTHSHEYSLIPVCYTLSTNYDHWRPA
jgi:hypothetical protein